MAATGSHPATPSTGAAPVEATASASRHAASAAATSAAAAGPGSPRNNDAAVAQVHRTLQALVHSLGSQHQLQSQIAELEREINAALRLIPDRGRSHGSLRAHETQSPSRDLATDFSLLAPSPAAHPSARDGEVAFGLASNRPLPRLPREPVHAPLEEDIYITVLKVYVQYSVMCVDKAIVTEVSNQWKCTREHGLKQGEGTRQNKTEGGK
ncbi:uncharacterized protein MONBRDRAFT_13156 [Monosiga brevicollis MX1]|uniref:Uncharacterized protein n=1 Tax=Monosiga brevicollis TaxID=81824 RepID=A9VEF9_MONBE|nr:uncharacterized protein MONBRDRAFT_13156 [Monosiga brevicollis MX1]EDQ84082.1 predicted protein [Monosiga brevicollis MX1]|eukprot:XP_001751106.1 hypothetical protein [Monosiga brevicollis MX1]